MSDKAFNDFCQEVDPQNRIEATGDAITFWNSNNQAFVLRYDQALLVLEQFRDENAEIKELIQKHWDHKPSLGLWAYREKVFRDVFLQRFKGSKFSSAVASARSQTKGYLSTLSKLVGWTIGQRHCCPPDQLLFDEESLAKFFETPKPLVPAVGKQSLGPQSLSDAFRRVCLLCKEYEASQQGWPTSDERALSISTALLQIAGWLKDRFAVHRQLVIKVDYAKGVGWFPRVPWVCLLPVEQSASDGVFVSICFGREGAGAVAGFAESVSKRRGLQVIERSKEHPLLINVDGPGQETRYNDSFENPKQFLLEEFDEEAFAAHLVESLDRCLMFLNLIPEEEFQHMHKQALLDGLFDTGFKSSDSLPERLLAALAAKPFVILTGNSGTGKTKLAELFTHWLCGKESPQHALVAVGADWTDNRNVLGFVNHLRPTEPQDETEEVPLYQSTKILDLLLEASREENKGKPFFLILDEMNLSHVERYFADFLSAMESRHGSLHLHREGRSLPRKPGGSADVPETLAVPRNVFVIGTVNVDETTYMFSPKVLDRANVIEFRVDGKSPKEFLDNGGRSVSDIAPAPAGYAEAFLQLSYRARSVNNHPALTLVADPDHPPADAKESLVKCRDTITDLFALMQKRHLEFGFRPMAEITRFLAVDFELAEDRTKWDWKSAMDAQILQKILPKLHGSKRKIGPLLTALACYCEAGSFKDADKLLASDAAVEAYHAEGDKVFDSPVFSDSHRKLCEMIVTVRRDQFVSFIQ